MSIITWALEYMHERHVNQLLKTCHYWLNLKWRWAHTCQNSPPPPVFLIIFLVLRYKGGIGFWNRGGVDGHHDAGWSLSRGRSEERGGCGGETPHREGTFSKSQVLKLFSGALSFPPDNMSWWMCSRLQVTWRAYM